MTSKALSYMRAEILARTVLSTVMSALTPIALLNVGQIIGESLLFTFFMCSVV